MFQALDFKGSRNASYDTISSLLWKEHEMTGRRSKDMTAGACSILAPISPHSMA